MTTPTSTIPGVLIRPLGRHSDERGWLIEMFRKDELPAGLRPAMGYVSTTRPGAIRGPHEHREQTDIFCFSGTSSFRLYLWDNRNSGRTAVVHETVDLPMGQYFSVVIPPGVVHAYKNIGSVDGVVMNFPDRLYAGPGRTEPVDEIRHEDDPESPFKIDDED
ncbi:dTDP-4-dehydrorhamnose 3,5-epimerase family protein [bacterium]|nr:dTDP-4-dehydrorhamnose 3,5-epimerase family protein [bacterium]MCB2201925.1 dTDP-4-dehydrorhamnose 3,5-epimerase family protein [bacterium]